MRKAEPKIQVIIPNWNGWKMLQHCLQSLENQSFQDFSIIVVDNGSTDETVESLKTHYPHVDLISYEENTGFSVAVNAGIRKSSADLLVLLNNDMEIAPDCLEKLYGASLQHQDYDSFAIKMMNYHDRSLIDGAGDSVLRGGVGYRLGTMETDGPVYSSDREVFGACAGAALYRRKFFETVGYFDEEFFAYVEDVDINIRARRLGLKCLFLASAVVYHIGSATSGSKINAFTIRLSTRNNFKVLIKNYPAELFVRFFLTICIYQTMWFLFCCKKGMIVPWWQGVMEAIGSNKVTRSSRKVILEKKNSIAPKQLAKQIKESEGQAISSIISRRSQQGKTSRILGLYVKLFL